MRSLLTTLTLVVCASAVTVEAQTAQPRPSRPIRGLFGGSSQPPDPNRTRSELTLTGSILGGYDDYILPGGPTGPVDPDEVQNGYTGVADFALRYFYGRTVRSFAANLRGFANTYSDIGVDPSIGSALNLDALTNLGRRNSLHATQSMTYEPSLVLGAFGSLQGAVEADVLPESGAGSGIVSQRSWASNTTLALSRRWTPRHTTSLQGGYAKRTYLDALGFDSSTYNAGTEHSWALTRTTNLEGQYEYSDSRVEDDEGRTMPLSDHTVEASISYRRRLTPTRQLQLTGGGGASYVNSQQSFDREPVAYWTPAGHASVRLDVGRTWAIAGDYRRSVEVLQGVTIESFATDAASVRTDGSLGSRFDVALSTAFSNGASGAGQSNGTFSSYGGSAQLRLALARSWAVTVAYDYYYYKLDGIADLPAEVPRQFDRNAVRIGLSMWFPLRGTFAGGGRGSEGR